MLKYSMIISQKSITNFNIEIQMLIPKIQPDNPKEEGKWIRISKTTNLTQLGRWKLKE